MCELRKALKSNGLCGMRIRLARSFGYAIEYKNSECL